LRIYPFHADASFAINTEYIISIDSDVIRDSCYNYYTGVSTSDSNAITFTTGDASGNSSESLANDTSGNIVSDGSGNNYIVFNTDTTFESKQYTLSLGSYTLDISELYPITIMNSDLSNIILISVSNDEIEIDVRGGTIQADLTTNDYFVFTNSNGETISLANGDFQFMRGQTYTFNDTGIDPSYNFALYYDTSSVSLPTRTPQRSRSFTIPEDMSIDYKLYYSVDHTTTTTTTTYDTSLSLLYADVSEDSDNVNGSYHFYYGNVVIDVCSNDFGSLSFYTYNNGYMGGKYAFSFEDNYYG
jgi:hypothetical protein